MMRKGVSSFLYRETRTAKIIEGELFPISGGNGDLAYCLMAEL